MEYIHDQENIKLLDKSIVVLGNFDGIHIGHQKLFKLAKELAKETKYKIVVFSFNPHPTWVLGNCPKSLLMTREEKYNKIKKIGIDIYIEYPFTIEFAKMGAINFIEDILIEKLNCKAVVVGKNYFFGENKEGNVDYLKKHQKEYAYETFVVPEVRTDKEVVSSSLIRKLIKNGDIQLANKLIGHPYRIQGTIIKGNQLGRSIGFPTANIMPDSFKVLPPNGAYITRVYLGDNKYYGLTNIGYNPTVNGKKKMVETTIFDFDKDVYGDKIKVEILKYIRKETRFEDLEELKGQLRKDKLFALEYIKEL